MSTINRIKMTTKEALLLVRLKYEYPTFFSEHLSPLFHLGCPLCEKFHCEGYIKSCGRCPWGDNYHCEQWFRKKTNKPIYGIKTIFDREDSEKLIEERMKVWEKQWKRACR